MNGQFILSDYLDRALAQAEYDKLEDGTFFGRVPSCKGVVAFAATLRECENELRSVLEDWVLVGLKLGHELPVLDSINLNQTFSEVAAQKGKKAEEVAAELLVLLRGDEKLGDDEFEKLADELADYVEKNMPPDAKPLTDYAMSREGI